jgi:hypothetical protein
VCVCGGGVISEVCGDAFVRQFMLCLADEYAAADQRKLRCLAGEL